MRASLALLATTLLALLLAVEVFLRSFYPCPWYGYTGVEPQRRKLFTFDSRLGWRGRPVVGAPFAGRDFYVRVTHDEHGHRSSAAPYVEGGRNLVVLGDSHGWGWGVEDDEVFSERMMQLRPELNVYNLSIPGYGTGLEYLALQGYLDRYPDALLEGVILVFSDNDLLDIQSVEHRGHPKPHFTLEAGRLVLHGVPVPPTRDRGREGEPVLGEPETHPLRRLHFFNLLDRGLRPLVGLERPKVPEPDHAGGLELAAHLIRAIRDAAQGRGAVLRVVLLRTKRALPWQEIEAILRGQGVPFLRFERRLLPSTHLWRDGHLSATGHRLLAERLLESLARGVWLVPPELQLPAGQV